MTSKKKRQRGSRTHSGGSHKNRRGAGHRGGRGNAGSRKHEMHNYEGRWDKYGFTRPEDAQEEVATVEVRTLDEDAALLAADGVAETAGDGYRLDARDVVEDGHEVDVVKVLGGGQVRNELHLLADDFSEAAATKVEAAGGSVELTASGTERAAETDKDTPDEQDES